MVASAGAQRKLSITRDVLLKHAHRLSQEEKAKQVIRRQYDPHNHLKNVLQVRGTMLQILFSSVVFWAFNILNILVFVAWEYLAGHHKARVLKQWFFHGEYMTPMGSLVVFAIVFYTGNCFIVYKDLFNFGCKLRRRYLVCTCSLFLSDGVLWAGTTWGLKALFTRNCLSRIAVWAVHLKSVLRTAGGAWEWQCIRHMLAAQRTFYYEMKKKMAEHHGFSVADGPSKHPGEWLEWSEQHLVQHGLLLRDEAQLLESFSGTKLLLLSSWSQTAFMEVSRQSDRFVSLSAPMQSQFLRHCLQENGEMEDLLDGTKDTVHFGVPFVYYHIVHLLVWLYLLLLPFAGVFVQEGEPSYWTLITYPIVSFVLLGVLGAADAMADPYGDDDCDFNVTALTEATFRDVVQLLGVDDSVTANKLCDNNGCALPEYLRQRCGSSAGASDATAAFTRTTSAQEAGEPYSIFRVTSTMPSRSAPASVARCLSAPPLLTPTGQPATLREESEKGVGEDHGDGGCTEGKEGWRERKEEVEDKNAEESKVGEKDDGEGTLSVEAREVVKQLLRVLGQKGVLHKEKALHDAARELLDGDSKEAAGTDLDGGGRGKDAGGVGGSDCGGEVAMAGCNGAGVSEVSNSLRGQTREQGRERGDVGLKGEDIVLEVPVRRLSQERLASAREDRDGRKALGQAASVRMEGVGPVGVSGFELGQHRVSPGGKDTGSKSSSRNGMPQPVGKGVNGTGRAGNGVMPRAEELRIEMSARMGSRQREEANLEVGDIEFSGGAIGPPSAEEWIRSCRFGW